MHAESCVWIQGTQRISISHSKYMTGTEWDIFYREYDFGSNTMGSNDINLIVRNNLDHDSRIT